MGPMELLSALRGLRDDEFREFLWYLKMPEVLGDYQPISEYQLVRAKRWDTVDLMVKAYTLDGAVKLTRKVLEKMNRKDLVRKLPDSSSGPEADSREVEMTDGAAAATTSSILQAPRPREDGPTLREQIAAAVAESKERRGLSVATLEQVLAAKGVDVAKNNKHISVVVLKQVRDGTLTQTKGIGASGFLKLPKKEPKAAKNDPAAAKKPETETAATAAKKATAEMMIAAKMAAEAAKAAAAAKKAAAEKAAVAKKAVAAGKVALAEKAAEKAAAAKKAAAEKAAVAKKAAEAANKAIAELTAAAKRAEAAEKTAAIKKAVAEKAAAAEKVAAAKKAAAEKAAAASGRRLSLPPSASTPLSAGDVKCEDSWSD